MILPENSGAATFSVSHTAALDQTSNIQKPVNDDKDIIYHQDFGGGGAGLGILLGPIGVAANISMIDTATQKDVDALKNKLALNPRALFVAEAKQQGLEIDNGKYLISPYVYIVKVEEGKLMLASALIVERRPGEEKWVGKYMYQLPMSYSVDELAHLDPAATDALNKAVAEGYAKLLATITKQQAAPAGETASVKFISHLLTPRIEFTMLGEVMKTEGDVTWFRTPLGVYALQKDSFTLVQ